VPFFPVSKISPVLLTLVVRHVPFSSSYWPILSHNIKTESDGDSPWVMVPNRRQPSAVVVKKLSWLIHVYVLKESVVAGPDPAFNDVAVNVLEISSAVNVASNSVDARSEPSR